MPMRDYYLTLSGLTSAGGVPGIQSITTAAAGATVSTWANSPFDTGLMVSSNYGQSPYQTANLNKVAAQIGQSLKKFFFLVTAVTKSSGGAATCGCTIQLLQNATAGVTGRTAAFQSAKLLLKTWTTAVFSTFNPVLCKVPLPEPLQRYINGAFVMSSGSTLCKVMAELTTY